MKEFSLSGLQIVDLIKNNSRYRVFSEFLGLLVVEVITLFKDASNSRTKRSQIVVFPTPAGPEITNEIQCIK